MSAQKEFNRQVVVELCGKFGELVLGRILALGIETMERFLTVPKQQHPELEFDPYQEFSRDEACDFLGIRITKLGEECKAGNLGFHRDGNRQVFIRAELERYRRANSRNQLE